MADPRHRRGVRYRLAAILGLALCAVVAGARSFTAIAEWAAHADEPRDRLRDHVADRGQASPAEVADIAAQTAHYGRS